jgi:hypothetical protein
MLVGMALIASQPLNRRIDRLLFPAEPKPAVTWTVGSEANVELTLITADFQRLNCASDATVDGYRCDFQANKRRWPRLASDPVDDNKETVIQPYRTADTNSLVMVGGLWAEPELALRLHKEAPSHFPEKKQLRFVAYCRVKFVGKLEDASLRWQRAAKWFDKQSGLVAKPLHCTLTPPEG